MAPSVVSPSAPVWQMLTFKWHSCLSAVGISMEKRDEARLNHGRLHVGTLANSNYVTMKVPYPDQAISALNKPNLHKFLDSFYNEQFWKAKRNDVVLPTGVVDQKMCLCAVWDSKDKKTCWRVATDNHELWVFEEKPLGNSHFLHLSGLWHTYWVQYSKTCSLLGAHR